MPLTEARKQYMKEYYKNNKEKRKEYYEANKQYYKEKDKKYYEANKEKIKEKIKQYRQTEAGIKSLRIDNWKYRGVISEDYDELYEMYINTTNCEECNVELIEGSHGNNKRCLDHCHKTGKFRNVLCHTCNVKRG